MVVVALKNVPVAYAALKMSNKRHIEKNEWIITTTDPTFASENRRRKTLRGPLLSVHPLSVLRQLLGNHGVSPSPSIILFQRRADKAGTRPPGQGGGSSHALPASWSPAPLQTELRQLVWPLGVGQDLRAPAQQQQLPAHCPPPTAPPTQLYKICIRKAIYCHSFTLWCKYGDNIAGSYKNMWKYLDGGLRNTISIISAQFHQLWQFLCMCLSSKVQLLLNVFSPYLVSDIKRVYKDIEDFIEWANTLITWWWTQRWHWLSYWFFFLKFLMIRA